MLPLLRQLLKPRKLTAALEPVPHFAYSKRLNYRRLTLAPHLRCQKLGCAPRLALRLPRHAQHEVTLRSSLHLCEAREFCAGALCCTTSVCATHFGAFKFREQAKTLQLRALCVTHAYFGIASTTSKVSGHLPSWRGDLQLYKFSLERAARPSGEACLCTARSSLSRTSPLAKLVALGSNRRAYATQARRAAISQFPQLEILVLISSCIASAQQNSLHLQNARHRNGLTTKKSIPSSFAVSDA